MEQLNITSAKYYKDFTASQNVGVIAIIDGVEWQIPLDTANTHYAEIMRQVEAGELTIQEADNS